MHVTSQRDSFIIECLLPSVLWLTALFNLIRNSTCHQIIKASNIEIKTSNQVHNLRHVDLCTDKYLFKSESFSITLQSISVFNLLYFDLIWCMGLPCIRYVLDGVYLCRAEPSRHNLKVSVFGQGLHIKQKLMEWKP